MDLVAGPVALWFIAVLFTFCLITGFASGLVHRKTGSLMAATVSGVLPLSLLWIAGTVSSYWSSPPPHTVIHGKTYTAQTLPPPTMPFPKSLPVDDPKRLDLLRSFGIENDDVDVCRKKGCRVDFTASGGISSFGPVKTGEWKYALDPATEKWKLKE